MTILKVEINLPGGGSYDIAYGKQVDEESDPELNVAKMAVATGALLANEYGQQVTDATQQIRDNISAVTALKEVMNAMRTVTADNWAEHAGEMVPLLQAAGVDLGYYEIASIYYATSDAQGNVEEHIVDVDWPPQPGDETTEEGQPYLLKEDTIVHPGFMGFAGAEVINSIEGGEMKVSTFFKYSSEPAPDIGSDIDDWRRQLMGKADELTQVAQTKQAHLNLLVQLFELLMKFAGDADTNRKHVLSGIAGRI